MTLEELQVRITAETSGFQKAMAGVQSVIKGAKLTAGILVRTQGYKQVKSEIQSLQRELNELRMKQAKLSDSGVTQAYVADYKSLTQEAANTEKQLEKLLEKQKQMENTGRAYKVSDEFSEIERHIEQLQKRISSLSGEKAKLESSGKAYESSFSRYNKEIEKAQGEIDNLMKKQDELNHSGMDKNFAKGIWSEYQRQIDELTKSIEILKAEQEQYKTPTKQFSTLCEQLNEARQELGFWEQDYAELKESGLNMQPTQTFQALQEEIDRTRINLAGCNEQIRSLGDEHGVTGDTVKEWENINSKMSESRETLNEFQTALTQMRASGADVKLNPLLTGLRNLGSVSFNFLQKSFDMIKTAITKTSGAFASLIHRFSDGIVALKKVGSTIGSVTGKVLSFTKSLLTAPVSVFTSKLSGLSSKLSNMARMVKSTILRMGIRSVISGLRDSFDNLVQYSDRANVAASSLMSSLTQFRNSLVAAFEPILTFVTPALTQLIGYLTQATTAIGQFFATLTGQSTVVVAKKVQQDYAASVADTETATDSAKQAAKEYQNELMGFDEVNKLSDQSDNDTDNADNSSSSELSPSDMFETVDVGNRFKDLVEKIKKAWSEADFTEIGAMVAEKINSALERIPWEKIRETTKKIAKSIATFLNGFIETLDWTTLGKTITEGLNTAFLFVGTFAKNFHWDSLGTAIGDGINGALGNINWTLIRQTLMDTVAGIADSLNQAMSSIDFGLLGSTISKGVNTTFMTVDTLVREFSWDSLGSQFSSGINGALETLDWNIIKLTVIDIIKGIMGFLNSSLNSTDWTLVGTSFGNVLNLVIEAGYTFIATLDTGEMVSVIEEFLSGAFETIDWQKLGEIISGVLTNALEFLKTSIAEFDWKQLGSDIAEWIAGIDWAGIVSDISEFLGIMLGSIFGFLQGLLGDVVRDIYDYFKEKVDYYLGVCQEDFYENCEGIGWLIITGLLDGIIEALINIGTWIYNNIFKPFIDGFKEAFGIHSPSTVMEEQGGFIIEGLLNGISEKISDIEQTFSDIKEAILEKLKGIKQDFAEKWEEIKQNTSSVFGTVKETVTDKLGSVKETVTDKLSAAKETVSSKLSDIKGFFSSKFGEVNTDVSKDMKEVSSAISTEMSSAKGETSTYLGDIQTSFSDKLGSAKSSADTAMSNIKSYIKDNLSSGASTTSQQLDKIKSYLSSLSGYVSNSFAKLWSSAWTSISDSVTNMFGNLPAKIKAAVGNLAQVGKELISNFVSGFQSIHIPTPHFSVTTSQLSIAGVELPVTVPKLSLSWYAKGGFPDSGEMFIANESGPELVGQIGNRTAVANQNQIVDAVSQGVANAVSQVFAGGNKNQPVEITVVLQGDSKQMFKVIRKEAINYSKQTGKLAFE